VGICVRTIVRQLAQRVLRVIWHEKDATELRIEFPEGGLSVATATHLPTDLGEKTETNGRSPTSAQKITPTENLTLTYRHSHP
jgi:hypothetical protein